MARSKRPPPIQLYLLTGFLGSGKTTLLNNLLELLRNKRTGIIINEFGETDIDRSMIDQRNLEMIKLSNGQIFFCGLAGDFVKAIVSFTDRPIDYLMIEVSGMANPASLDAVLGEVKKLTGDAFKYRERICVVDALQLLDLVQVLPAVCNQIARSEIILINKVDLVEESVVEEIEERIRKLQPDAHIYRTTYCSRVDQGQTLSIV